ncbi:glycosyltransferase family 29 protein [Rhizobium wenxiniae]|uniref:glycosyltransferase family 29 protein n=1 Tax=Rhizobium wenxiniae TaxID=1737357 RepID=UPI003C253394
MDQSEDYQKLREIIAADQAIAGSQILTPSLGELKSGSVSRGFLDFKDMLPQLSSDELGPLLIDLASTGQRAMGVISPYYSNQMREDGLNLYRTVMPDDWWKALLEKHFLITEFVASHRGSEFLWTNFKVSEGTRLRLARVGKVSSVRRELSRLISRTKVGWRSLTGQCVRPNDLLALLDGKSVAVVGNARSLNCQDFGREIDSHDIVIRFNRVPIVSRGSHGYRTTWVATGVPINQQRLSSLGASHVLWLSRYRRKIPRETASIDNLYLHPTGMIDALAERSNVMRPTTGLAAIDLLSSSMARQITLYGFDFYLSQSSSSHQTIEAAPHQFDREELFVRTLVQDDHRFVIK